MVSVDFRFMSVEYFESVLPDLFGDYLLVNLLAISTAELYVWRCRGDRQLSPLRLLRPLFVWPTLPPYLWGLA